MSIRNLQEKWAPVLEHDALPEIGDSYKKGVVAQLLENERKLLPKKLCTRTKLFKPLVTLGRHCNWSCCWF